MVILCLVLFVRVRLKTLQSSVRSVGGGTLAFYPQ
jgi:hypothetical protein